MRLSLGLQVKLASLLVHLDEVTGPDPHAFDVVALRGLLGDVEVRAWMERLSRDGLLPVKRTGAPKPPRKRGGR